jgi:DNA-binding Lrp family transcriptional regulator
VQIFPIDRTDRRLLLELSQHGRATNVELAQTVHLSASAVARRQRALEDGGVVRGYAADIERVHKTQLSRLPHVARIQSSFALRDVVRRALPADLLRD